MSAQSQLPLSFANNSCGVPNPISWRTPGLGYSCSGGGGALQSDLCSDSWQKSTLTTVGKDLESVQFGDIKVASVFANDDVLLASRGRGV